LDAVSVADYLSRVQDLTCLEDPLFSSREDVSRFLAAVEQERQDQQINSTHTGTGAIFAGIWKFKSRGKLDKVARSSSACLCAAEGTCNSVPFDVNLSLNSTHQGSAALSWELRFGGEILTEALDYIEVDLSGSLVGLGSNVPAAKIPTAHFQAGRLVQDTSAMDLNTDAFLDDTPLFCILRVTFHASGEEQNVFPAGFA
jgi:hypothetical protein